MWSDAEGSDVTSKDSYDSLLDSHSDSSKSSQRSVSKGRREQNQQRHRQRAVARKERETRMRQFWEHEDRAVIGRTHNQICLLYTSDAADEEDSVDLGGRRIIKKKKMKAYSLIEHHRDKRTMQ
eukprot:TRINITY_DN24657_c0_g2_i1.p1 TRINITY_DN24657_c0_g2~~TRINITY_DN24657_c0_g2_i1.p1  ORF type:complete len:124 (-),score=15.76 TRINITY_DN24657_c0_g2_i1:37-408(-)